MSGTADRVVILGGLAALMLTELRKEFYAPYFNPRLRWWEQARRYSTDRILVFVKEFGTGVDLFQAASFDVSATGIYIVSDRAVKIGDAFALEVVLPGDIRSHATGEVVWAHPGGGGNPPGFGCRFTATSGQFKADLSRAIRALQAAIKDR